MHHYSSDRIVPLEGVQSDLPLNEGDFIEEAESEEEMDEEEKEEDAPAFACEYLTVKYFREQYDE